MTLPSLNYDKKAVDTFEFELYSLEQGRGVDNFWKVGGLMAYIWKIYIAKFIYNHLIVFFKKLKF